MGPALIAVAGAAAISGLAQAYVAAKAQKASQKQLEDIKAQYNAIKPSNFNVAIDAPPEVIKNTLALPQFSDPLQAPKYNLDKLSPEMQQQVGQLVPQYAQYIKENPAQTLQTTGDMSTGRAAQMAALKKYTDIGEGEIDPQYQQQVTQAQNAAQQQANSADQSILQDAARRGVQNSGLALANQQTATGQSMNSLANSNLGAATQSYQNRLNALSQGAGLGAQIQGQDLNMQAQNANIINAFNQRMQQGQQSTANQQAAVANQAQAYNLGSAQNIANQNVNSHNQFAVGQQQRGDVLTQQGYNAALGQQAIANQLAQQQYGNQVGQLNQNNAIATQLAQWNENQRAVQNQLANNQFQQQIQKVGGQAAPMYAQIGMNTQNAQNTNQAIQGVANVGTIYGQQQAAGEQQSANAANAANMAQYQRTGQWMTPDQVSTYQSGGTLSNSGSAPASQSFGLTGSDQTAQQTPKKNPYDPKTYNDQSSY